MMQCPSCEETIDDDSRYCDQCGVQIMVCPVCGRPGKGKFCMFDSNNLVPSSGGVSAPVVQAPLMQTVSQSSSSNGKIKLASQTHGIMLEAQDGDIIGSKNGAFAGVFSRFNHVSRTHCKLVKTAAGWHIQDMGSTNGTFCNGIQLVPNTLYPLASGTTIKIADIELLITYDETGGGTTRI